LVTVTATFRLLYVFIVIEHGAAGARASARAGTWSFLQSHALKVVERVVDGVSFVGDAATRSVVFSPGRFDFLSNSDLYSASRTKKGFRSHGGPYTQDNWLHVEVPHEQRAKGLPVKLYHEAMIRPDTG
jgi:hypothetical protein